MLSVDVTKFSQKEYHNYFKDVLKSLKEKTFKPSDELLFITYQPKEHTLNANEVIEFTYQQFSKYRYVEVIEQTFKTKKGLRYNYGGYINGCHSHLIIKEEDYKAIKHQLKDLDIVAKVIYDIDGIYKYLSKQAGISYNRLLPTNNIPITPPTQAAKKTIQRISTATVKKLLSKVIKAFPTILINYVSVKCFKKRNKIDTMQVFVDDT